MQNVVKMRQGVCFLRMRETVRLNLYSAFLRVLPTTYILDAWSHFHA